MRMTGRLYAVAGRTWGMDPAILKMIMDRAVRPMVLYGAEIWGARHSDQRINKALDTAQRPYLKHITRAYNTAPTAALQVLAGAPPWNLEAAKIARIRRARNRALIEVQTSRISEIKIEPNVQEETYVSRQIYTEGTKSDTKVAAAMVVRTGGTEE